MSYVLCLLIVIWPIACVSRGTRVASQPHRKRLSCAAMLPSNDHSVWRIKMSSSRHQHEPSQRRWCWLGYDVVCVVVFDDAPESIIFWLKTYHEPCFHIFSHKFANTPFSRLCVDNTNVVKQICFRDSSSPPLQQYIHYIPSSLHAFMMNLSLILVCLVPHNIYIYIALKILCMYYLYKWIMSWERQQMFVWLYIWCLAGVLIWWMYSVLEGDWCIYI